MQKFRIERLCPSPNKGLTEAQVRERAAGGAVNVTTQGRTDSIKVIICRNVFTYFNLIFAVLAALLIIVRKFSGLTFMPVIIANTLVGIIQQIRSKRTLDKLNMLNAPKARLIRDGKRITVNAEEAVLDDIAVFTAGNQIYADAVIVDGEVKVNESLLTGEADEITRSKGDTLMSGSFIVSGECRARLDKVGDDSYIAGISAQAKQSDNREHSKMMSALNKLIKTVGIIIIPIGIAMFLLQHCVSGRDAAASVSSMVAALLGMIPEGLYLLASVALTLSVMRLAYKKVNVHDISCVETLARVNVLCVDKTGTITDNTMEVNSFVPLNIDKEVLFTRLSDFAAAMSADNITMDAMKRYFNKSTAKADKVVPFLSSVKYSAAVFGGSSYVLGAPELVLRGDYSEYADVIKSYMEKGFRVLVFADYASEVFDGPLTEKAVPLGLVLLRNPVRKEAPEVFGYFTEQGVAIKVISGDSPVTASEVAREANIPGAENYIDASTIGEDNIAEAVKRYTVFGRVTPEMKRKLLYALQAQGNTVAMTGDGVNDVLALKAADCSVAMASGSEAAANVSQIVLMDSDFSHMPDVIAEGRRVVNNIERSAGLFLIKNIFSFLLAVFTIVAMFNYPLEPSQVTLINAFTIGAPAFLLALENNRSLIKGSFLANVIIKSLPAALTNFITIGTLVAYGKATGLAPEAVSTAATLIIAAVGFFVLFLISRPLNLFRAAVLILMTAGFSLSVVLFSWFFGLMEITGQLAVIILIFALSACVLLLILTAIIKRAELKLRRFLK